MYRNSLTPFIRWAMFELLDPNLSTFYYCNKLAINLSSCAYKKLFLRQKNIICHIFLVLFQFYIALYIRLHGHGKVETLKACVEIFWSVIKWLLLTTIDINNYVELLFWQLLAAKIKNKWFRKMNWSWKVQDNLFITFDIFISSCTYLHCANSNKINLEVT